MVLVDGALALYAERGGKTLLAFTDDAELLACAAGALVQVIRRGAADKMTVEKVNGEPILDTPLARALMDAGFYSTPQGTEVPCLRAIPSGVPPGALHAALAGQELTASDFRVPRYATLDLSGQTVDEVRSRGKHLLMRIGALTVHSHLQMEGSWQVYQPGERWRKPASRPASYSPPARRRRSASRWHPWRGAAGRRGRRWSGHLGPDLLGPDWDADEALRRLRQEPDRPIGLALLDQRHLAGIGNVYRCEVCFIARVHPPTPVGQVPDLPAMVLKSKQLLEVNKDRGSRSTTGSPVRRERSGSTAGHAVRADAAAPRFARPARQHRRRPARRLLLPALPAACFLIALSLRP